MSPHNDNKPALTALIQEYFSSHRRIPNKQYCLCGIFSHWHASCLFNPGESTFRIEAEKPNIK